MVRQAPHQARRLACFLALLLASMALAPAAQAKVTVYFHSFNGSIFFGRYPHTFVVFDGTLDDTGEKIFENFGFSAKVAGPGVLAGPVEHVIVVEEQKYIDSTNRHFSVEVDDKTYHRMRDEVEAWRSHPGKYYDLDTRNCIHFVGRMAELAGLKVEYPKKLLRKPKAWLNLVTGLNPVLHAKAIR
jgi:hypothetical protein